jgi:DNA polymerase III delta prime subunit
MNNMDDNNSELWVEKYRPKKISSFTGNKKNILLIKQWMDDYADKNPNFKPILLLVGEPGVGKTTLANLILNEYKYDIIEINASKLEGKSEIHKHFDNITTRGIRVLYSKSNKTGVVLDEVDGMAQNETTMKEFLSIIDPVESNKDVKKKLKEKNKKKIKKKIAMGFDGKMKKGKKVSDVDDELSYEDKKIREFDEKQKLKEDAFYKFPFRYPIICTANKATDKRMKKLCRRALVIRIEKPTKQIFTKFAQKIVKLENIDINIDALELLIERSNYDFRQLISNLQMVSIQDHVTVEDVNILIKGRDIDQNLFDIVYNMMNKDNSIEDLTLMASSERRPISNMIYHNIINVVDYNRTGKRKDKIDVLSKIMESIADGQKFDRYSYDESVPHSIVKNIIQPIVISRELKTSNKGYHMESYNIQNYKSQETKTYSNYVSYFIDKFGTFDTKTVFQLCYIIIFNLTTLNIDDNEDVKNSKAIKLMKEYELGSDDINKMCKICCLVPEVESIQTRIDTTKFKRAVHTAINSK